MKSVFFYFYNDTEFLTKHVLIFQSFLNKESSIRTITYSVHARSIIIVLVRFNNALTRLCPRQKVLDSIVRFNTISDVCINRLLMSNNRFEVLQQMHARDIISWSTTLQSIPAGRRKQSFSSCPRTCIPPFRITSVNREIQITRRISPT